MKPCIYNKVFCVYIFIVFMFIVGSYCWRHKFFTQIIYLIKNNPKRINRNKSYYCIILDSRVFEIFIIADELFEKALRILETCTLFNNNLYGILVTSWELQMAFVERFKVTSGPFFLADFIFLSCKFENFTFKVLYCIVVFPARCKFLVKLFVKLLLD